jgi:hypothetical protein
MRHFIFFVLFLTAYGFTQAAEEALEKDSENIETSKGEALGLGNKVDGSFLVYGGYNKTNYDDGITIQERSALQEKPYMGVYGILRFKNLEAFGVLSNNKYGFSSEILLNSHESENPLRLKEAAFVISSEISGTRVLGIQTPVSSKFKINSTSFAGGNGGIAGKWQNFIKYPFLKTENVAADIVNSNFITKPYLPIEHGFASTYVIQGEENAQILQPIEGWGEENIGVSYISNRTKGFRVGISYFPENDNPVLLMNSKNLEDEKGLRFEPESFTNKDSHLKNITTFGANFYDQFGNVEVAFSALYEFGASVSMNYDYERHNLKAYTIGANVGYLGFTFGGSFVNYGRSLQVKTLEIAGNNFYYDENGSKVVGKKSYAYDVGIGYSIDKYSLNLAYLRSTKVGNDFWASSVSFETKLGKNLLHYFQIAKYQFTQSNQFDYRGERSKTAGLIMLAGIKYKLL